MYTRLVINLLREDYINHEDVIFSLQEHMLDLPKHPHLLSAQLITCHPVYGPMVAIYIAAST